jgi:ankyrin repeat protein
MAARPTATLPEKAITALYRKDYKALGRFLNKNTVNLREEGTGRTLLMLAVGLEDGIAMLRFLIDHGADVNLHDHTGRYTALHFAASDIDKEAVRILLAAGADPNAPDESGWTPLHHVVRGPDTRVLLVLDLVGKGADPAQKDGAGVSPRDEARRLGEGNLLRCMRTLTRGRKPKSKGKRA